MKIHGKKYKDKKSSKDIKKYKIEREKSINKLKNSYNKINKYLIQ